MRSSGWTFHPIQGDDGIYAIRTDGSGLKQLANVDATTLGWVGSSVAVQRTVTPYPAIDYAIEMLSFEGQATSLFASTRMAYYNLAPDGGALLVTDAQGETRGGSQKSVDLLALDGSITHTFGIYSNMTQSIWVTDWSSDSSQIAFANLRRENDRFGRRRVITDLKSRGVHSEVIDKAVAGAYEGVNEEALAREYLRRKRLQKPADQKQAARIFRQLVRAGFGSRTAFAILKKWNVDGETLEALEGEPSDPS